LQERPFFVWGAEGAISEESGKKLSGKRTAKNTSWRGLTFLVFKGRTPKGINPGNIEG
jgi:hypothetical protein